MAKVTMILVGGFLGAGKTTLLARAAQRLAARGRRVGLITNDQAANLVDTEILRQGGREVKEVSGACFCCAFNKLLYVCDNLISQHNPDVIIAEPVGSCTDLAATVLRPMKKLCADRFCLAPYSVLVDPQRLRECLDAGEAASLRDAVAYIYRKQIQEADLIVINKTDLLTGTQADELKAALAAAFPKTPAVSISALKDEGVDAWLDRIEAGGPAGEHVIDVDYDTYASGEAELGWLNAAVDLSAESPADWHAFASALMRGLQARFAASGAQIAHLKILLRAQGEPLRMHLTSTGGGLLAIDGDPRPSKHATLLVNARVRIDPEGLQAAVTDCLRTAAGKTISLAVAELTSFRPGRPNPVHRDNKVPL